MGAPRGRVIGAALAIGAALLMLAVVGSLRQLARAILFPRDLAPQDPSALRTEGLERAWLESPAGPVEVWFLPGRGIDDAHPGPAVVFTHGNAELIDHWPAALEPYRALGVSVVLPEYRGYGRSAGEPSEDAIREDLRALHAWMGTRPAIDRERLVYHGRSLGGGAIGTLLGAHPPRALILESTFTSVPDAAPAWAPAFLLPDRFDTHAALQSYRGPTLVFHGVHDRVIPVSHGRRLAAAAREGELVLYGCDHNDLARGADYWDRVERHLRGSGVLR